MSEYQHNERDYISPFYFQGIAFGHLALCFSSRYSGQIIWRKFGGFHIMSDWAKSQTSFIVIASMNCQGIIQRKHVKMITSTLLGELIKCAIHKSRMVSRRFLQSKVLGEVCLLEGDSSGRSFCRSFRACLLGHSEQKKLQQKNFSPNFHASAQQNWQKNREKLHDEALQGYPHQPHGTLNGPF